MDDRAPGDAADFAQLYEAHKADVYRWSLRFVGGRRGLAEDLAHDVFVKLLERRAEVGVRDDVGAWLYRVTANLAIDHLRRERSWTTRLARLFAAEQPEEEPRIDRALELRDEARRALTVVDQLPARERIVIWMALVDDRSQREIATALGLSEGYVSKLLDRAKARVRREGWEVSDGRA